MIVLLKKHNKTYGGYTYVEIATALKIYAQGDSRAHRGHAVGPKIETWVSKGKDLKDAVEDLPEAYVEVDSL